MKNTSLVEGSGLLERCCCDRPTAEDAIAVAVKADGSFLYVASLEGRTVAPCLNSICRDFGAEMLGVGIRHVPGIGSVVRHPTVVALLSSATSGWRVLQCQLMRKTLDGLNETHSSTLHVAAIPRGLPFRLVGDIVALNTFGCLCTETGILRLTPCIVAA